jgi:hypothetical protein
MMKFHRTLSEAFSDERAYCIEGPRGRRCGFYLKPRQWWARIWSIFK